MAKTSIRRGLFGFLSQPAEKPPAPVARKWWTAHPVDDSAPETQASPVAPAATPATTAVYASPTNLTTYARQPTSSSIHPPVEPGSAGPAENLDESAHQLVVPVIPRRKASVGPATRPPEELPLPANPSEQASTPPAEPENLPPALSYVQKFAAPEATAAADPTLPGPALPASERFTISLTLLGWVGLAGIILAVAGGFGYYAGLARGNRPAPAPAVPTPQTLEAVKSGPAKPGLTHQMGGKAAPTATPGKKPLDLPLAAPNLEKGKRYIVIQEGLAGEDEAAEIIRFLKDNDEAQVGAIKYRLGNVSKWRVVSLKPWDAKDTPQTKKLMDDYKRRIETLGQKYKKAGGHYEFVRPYDRLF